MLICRNGHVFKPNILNWLGFNLNICNFENCIESLIFIEK